MSLLQKQKMVQVKRGSGTYEYGKWVYSESYENEFYGTAQPETGRVLELLPEGKRNRDTITVFAPISMLWTCADTDSGEAGDLILWDGKTYEVEVAHKWKNNLINHWELLATRVPPEIVDVEDEIEPD